MPNRTSCIRSRLLKICSILPNNAYRFRMCMAMYVFVLERGEGREREREREREWVGIQSFTYTQQMNLPTYIIQPIRTHTGRVHSHNSQQLDLAHLTHSQLILWVGGSSTSLLTWTQQRERSIRQRRNITSSRNGWIPFKYLHMYTCMY